MAVDRIPHNVRIHVVVYYVLLSITI